MARKEMKFGISPLMSIEELATYYRVSAPLVRSWIKSGARCLPPHINVGTDDKPMIRFLAVDVQNHIKGLRDTHKKVMPQGYKIPKKSEDPDVLKIDSWEVLDDDD